MGIKKITSVLLISGDCEFYCLQLKSPVGISKILLLFPVGMRVQCSFPMAMKFQGIFFTKDKFLAEFSVRWGIWSVHLRLKGYRHTFGKAFSSFFDLNIN